MVTFNTLLRSILAAAALAVVPGGLRAQLAPGAPFPSLASAGLVGTVPETAGKVVLVDFWASWCAPCKASFPFYSQLNTTYGSRGLVVLAVSVDKDPSAYASFVKQLKPSFVTVQDARQKLVADVQVPTMPTSYLVDRTGKVRFLHAGFHGDQTEHEVLKEVEALLGEKGPGS
ncbi:MAG TPA: TlpA disulfide reductase family protein [Opitutaceae bacterium]|jgi:thiol-disulfide isomerase/thioredoxin